MKHRTLNPYNGAQRPEATPRVASPRIMFYSHDTYGLGHLRRTLALAHHLPAGEPLLSQLIVTGSPLADRFRLPPGADYVKLPSVVKVGADRYEPRYLPPSFGTLHDLRRELLLAAAREFRPQVLVVDNVPTGLEQELLPALRLLKRASCQLVLGLRDVVDEAAWVRRAWARDDSYGLLDDLYDRILVYGRQDLFDVVEEYRFSSEAAEKTRFVGYLRREPATRSADTVRAEIGMGDGPLVLVMAGGGGDGYHLLQAVVDAIRYRQNGRKFSCVLLGGPLMPLRDRERVLALTAGERSIRYVDFVEETASYVAAADLVVSMGGYNSVCELLSNDTPAIVVPRISPRKEQLIRARFLSKRGLLRMIHPSRLTPERLRDLIDSMLKAPFSPRARLPLDGLPAATAELEALLRVPARPVLSVGG